MAWRARAVIDADTHADEVLVRTGFMTGEGPGAAEDVQPDRHGAVFGLDA